MKNRVLLCDDDDGILDVGKILLEEKGYIVKAITQTADLLNTIDDFSPDLIMLDVWMPGQGGEELTEVLKKDIRTRHIPVILMSAQRDLDKKAGSAGADGYLSKPFDIADFENKVVSFLGEVKRASAGSK